MSYNGSGTFLINSSGQPVVSGTVISSSTFNTLTADLGTGLSTAITKDGQTTTTSRIPFIAGISSTLTTDSTSVGTGSIITSGGVGIAKALFVGTTANIAGAVTLGGAVAITSSSANALAVGLNGATNPAFNVDASTASSATGLNVKSAAAAGGVALSVTSSGSNEALTLNAKGTGTIGIGSVSTGAVTITPATTVTGAATLSSTLAVTGISSFAAGTAAAPAITRTGDLDTGVYFPAANSLGLSTSGTNAVYIDSSQNVGIGTSSPAEKLHVVATSDAIGVQVSGSVPNVAVNFYNSGTGGRNWGVFSTNNSSGAGGGNFAIYDYIAGSYRAIINSSGNLGIGTTSPTGQASDNRVIQIYGAGTNNRAQIHLCNSDTGETSTDGSFIGVDTTKALYFVNRENAATIFENNGAESARITAAGLLLVGTTTAYGTSKLVLVPATSPTTASSSAIQLSIGEATANTSYSLKIGYINEATSSWSGSIQAIAGGSPAPLILNGDGGNVFICTTTSGGKGLSILPQSTNGVLTVYNTDYNGFVALQFRYNGSAVGAITINSTTTTYGTSSDYRLKNTIAPMTGALAKVALLKPCTYKWNLDNSASQGFIAHELQAVVPECVTGVKDAVNEDGSIKSQGIDTSFLVATLTAAIQEQQALIQSLTTRLTALEAK